MAGLKDKVEGEEQEEEMRQKSAERKEAESLFWAKFNLSPSDVSSGAVPTAASTAATSPSIPRLAAASSEETAPENLVLRAAPAAAEAVARFTYQSLSTATSNFKKRLHTPLPLDTLLLEAKTGLSSST